MKHIMNLLCDSKICTKHFICRLKYKALFDNKCQHAYSGEPITDWFCYIAVLKNVYQIKFIDVWEPLMTIQ